MHYSRIPRALWRDRLLRIKRAGFNTIETYAFWNFHEMQEGKWDFSGDKDFGAYLRLIKELGMYAIVRVGPYVCAEWDSGGYPVWLRFRPGVQVRVDNAAFEGYVDKWFDKIMPIVAANQIHKGGAVILVQLENEHPLGWGKEMPNGYFTHLRDKALSLGLQVPYFFSGLHHGHDPAGDQPWDSAARTNPWMTTEFWPGWYDIYGPLNARDYRTYTRGLWKILAYGGNGYNFYMLHGGTDFDTWNDDEVASNYDYGAAVGQTGDPRPVYYAFKRGSLFARSFRRCPGKQYKQHGQVQGHGGEQRPARHGPHRPGGNAAVSGQQHQRAHRIRRHHGTARRDRAPCPRLQAAARCHADRVERAYSGHCAAGQHDDHCGLRVSPRGQWGRRHAGREARLEVPDRGGQTVDAYAERNDHQADG